MGLAELKMSHVSRRHRQSSIFSDTVKKLETTGEAYEARINEQLQNMWILAAEVNSISEDMGMPLYFTVAIEVTCLDAAGGGNIDISNMWRSGLCEVRARGFYTSTVGGRESASGDGADHSIALDGEYSISSPQFCVCSYSTFQHCAANLRELYRNEFNLDQALGGATMVDCGSDDSDGSDSTDSDATIVAVSVTEDDDLGLNMNVPTSRRRSSVSRKDFHSRLAAMDSSSRAKYIVDFIQCFQSADVQLRLHGRVQQAVEMFRGKAP